MGEGCDKGDESGSWYGIAGPANTPRPIIERLNSEIVAAVKSSAIQKRLIKEPVIPSGNSSEAFAAFIEAEFERMGRVIREARIVSV